MADITWTNVTNHAAELSAVGASAQTDILGFVNDSIDPAFLDGESGYRTKLARIYLAAHFGTIALAAGSGGLGASAAGPVASKSADGLSISYAVMTAGMNDPSMLGVTKYGQQYLGIVNTSAARGGWIAN